jgi:hypothetical protein
MAVAFDAVSSSSVASGTGTLTWTHTPVAAPPSSVGVGLVVYTNTGVDVASVTYNGVALTKAISTLASINGFRTEVWGSDGMILPSGAQSIVISFSGSSGGDIFCIAGAITTTGSNTTTCFSGSAGATGDSSGAGPQPSVSCPSATGEFVMNVCSNIHNDATLTPAQTIRWGLLAAGGLESGGSSTPASAGSTGISWTQATGIGTNEWALSAASFKVAGGAAASISLGILGLATAEW